MWHSTDAVLLAQWVAQMIPKSADARINQTQYIHRTRYY